MSRHNCGVPIYARHPSPASARKMALYCNVRPPCSTSRGPRPGACRAEDLLVRNGFVIKGDDIVLTIGEPMGKSGGTNTLKIVRVGENRD
jgi:pyruvate kinase